jgi:Family of unknown function (DUF6328)
MKLQDALKTSLDELRMQMLGAQVLFGFQFQGLFQNNFRAVQSSGRILYAVGLVLMISVLGLLIAVPCQHRLVDGGETTLRIYAVSICYATLALVPLAGAIACDVFVATERPFGMTVSVTIAACTAAMTVIAWFWAGMMLRRRWDMPDPGEPMQQAKTELHVKIEQMLTESRVILPGAQALLGFQLIVTMTKEFDDLPPPVRVVHLVALLSLALAIILLIAPAAIHRLSFGGRDDPRLQSIGSLLITTALLPLACAISCDVLIALTRLFGDTAASRSAALVVLFFLLGLWYVLPLLIKRTLKGAVCRE